MDWIFLVAISLVIFYIWGKTRKSPSKYPKGPFKFPLLGNVPQLYWKRYVKKIHRHEIYEGYAKEYGSAFSMQLGPFRSIVLNDAELIKQAWNNPELCGRPKLIGAEIRTGGTVRGLLFQDGSEWSEQRRFTIRHLRDFGFGKRSMENLVMSEVTELIEGLKKDKGEPIPTSNKFNIAVINSLWSIVTGKRFSHDDPELGRIIDSINKSLSAPGMGIIIFFPFLRHIIPNISGWTNFVTEITQASKFIEKVVKEKLSVYDPTQQAQDFSDIYIQEIRKTTDPGSSFHGNEGEKNMVANLLDLFVAGAETTSTTLTWYFLYMALFPEKQELVKEEIDKVLGTRQPTLKDRESMPYTQATILETLRYSSMVPLGIFHKALTDVVLDDFVIPKNTFVAANFHHVHHSVEIWGDPENFRPERFLDTNKEKVVKHECLMAFSYGKRVCLGETLAKDELFLFIASLLQEFTVKKDPGVEGGGLTKDPQYSNLISPPQPHNLVFQVRH